MDALVLTPIAPHTLTNRPIVIPAEREVRVRSTSSNAGDEVYVTFDGQTGFGLHEGDEVAIAQGRSARCGWCARRRAAISRCCARS